jgi:hypothetical protein
MARMARIARAAVLLCLVEQSGCADNPYFIGHARNSADAGVGKGGTGGMGGAGGATTADAGPEAGSDASANDCADALVCAGFERENLSAEWSDTVIENSGALERSTVRAHSGGGSLRAQSRANASVADVVARFPPLRSGMLYLRAYLFVPDGLPTERMNLFFIGSRPDPDPSPFAGLDLNLENGAVQLFSPQAKPQRQTGELTVPRDRWFCLRAEIELGSAAAVSVFVDDALALRATGVDSIAEGGVSMLRAGIDWSSDQDAFFELYLDDVALDTRPVGCLGD